MMFLVEMRRVDMKAINMGWNCWQREGKRGKVGGREMKAS